MPNGPGDDDRQKRTPMRWTATADGGFSVAAPWIVPSTDDPAVSVQAQRADPGSVLAAYREAIALRAAWPALAAGDAQVVAGLPSAVLAVWRTLPGAEPVLVLANLGARDVEVDLADLALGGVAPSTLRALGDGGEEARSGALDAPGGILRLYVSGP